MFGERRMEIGISTYLYHDADLLKGLEKLSCLGYRFIEINPHGSSYLSSKKDVAEVAKYAGSLGLTVNSIHLGNCPNDIGSSDPKERQKGIEWIERNLDLYQVFQPKYLGIHRPGLWEDLSDPEHFKKVTGWAIESVTEVAKFSRERGLKLEVETSGGYGDVKTLREIVAPFPKDEVGILVDTGHCWRSRGGTGDPALKIREADDRLFGVHIHDNHRAEDEHLVPGEGTIDWSSVLEALKDVGYEDIFTLECANSTTTQDRDTIALLAKQAAERLLAARD
ncbi:MAG TPA: sugar phosphate isomerase/epimerase [Candidatus Latescibacteria bacterium]|nr:sugar phosphate isomerase/epimerase [Candidatus Latescibacterota bacterium]